MSSKAVVEACQETHQQEMGELGLGSRGPFIEWPYCHGLPG